jgi:hypothetical protein
MVEGIADPLAAVRAVCSLDVELGGLGYRAALQTDFAAFSALRRKLRNGEAEAALFDVHASAITPKKGFWMSLANAEGRIVALQAFRADHAEPSLADWALGWILGVYLKRSELIVPERIEPPANSVAKRFSGTVVYHGELWLEREFRGQNLMEPFARLGVLLSYIRWQPVAIWALNSEDMALQGKMTRMGYAHQERGFLRWSFLPGSADSSEWLSIADRSAVEQLIEEMVLTRPECRPG